MEDNLPSEPPDDRPESRSHYTRYPIGDPLRHTSAASVSYQEMVAFVLAQSDNIMGHLATVGTNLDGKIAAVSTKMDNKFDELMRKLDMRADEENKKRDHELELVKQAKRSTIPVIISMVAALCSVVGTLSLLHIHFGGS